MYSLLIALLYLAYIGLGLPSSLIGSAWPAMHNALNVPISYVGVISMVISGGTIVSSLLSDKLTRKLGTRVVTVLSVFITTLTLFGFSFSNTFWMLIVFAIPYGLASGAIDAAVNNYVAVHYESKHLSWLHSFWGVGAIISPFIMSYALTNSTWDKGYLFVTYIQLGISLLLLVTLPVWKVNHREVEVSETTKSVGLLDALKIRGVPFLLIGFFAYCAMEGTVKLWASSYFVEVKGVTDELAALYASLFFIGLTVGRIFGGFLTNKLSDRKMIRLGTGVLSFGIILLFVPVVNHIVAVAGFILIGLGSGPIFPCIIHSTPSNFGAENSGAIIGIQMASAYAGSTFIPPVFGLLGDLIDFSILPVFLAAFVVLMIILIEKTFIITQNKDLA